MNNNFIVYFLVLSTLSLSSCRKEEGCMNPIASNYNASAEKDDGSCIILGCTNPIMYNYDPNANTDNGGCIPFIDGCTNPTMFNYNLNANNDDGSCITAKQAALGIWNVTPDCDEINIPILNYFSINDQIPQTILVNEGTENIVYIDLGNSQYEATIDNSGNLTVSPQTSNVDIMGISVDMTVSGIGYLESEDSGLFELNYQLDIPLIGTQNIECTITISQQ